jgi:acetyltransferase-like isoleucine patch superfamily enzyme
VDIHYPFNLCIGKGTIIPGHCTIIASGEGVNIGKNVELHEGAYLHCQDNCISIGDNTSIGPYVIIYGGGRVKIGAHCGIAAHTSIISTSHNFDRVDVNIRSQGNTQQLTVIGDDVWIGTHCSVLMGTCIGEGSVLGAGTVLRKSVPPYSVVVGVPGRVLRQRTRSVIAVP